MISAAHIAAEVRRGERSARDTVAGALTQADAQQERLNINTFIDRERAIERAEEIDRMVEAGRDPGPLAGVPVAVKDLIDHAGRVTTCGSKFYNEVAETTAPAIERLERAGAIMVTRTGLHEFAYGFSSENHWFGPVRNPLDPELSPGGSSGGSASAVAAEQVPVAIGTDTGGSVRVPAALCGIYGLKVTHGRIPLTGVFPLAASLDTVGPLAATVGDLALAYQAMAGHDPSDRWSAVQPVVTPGGARPDLGGLRVGIPAAWVDTAPITDSVADAFAEAVAAMRGLGATVETIEDSELTAPGMVTELAGGEIARVHRNWKQAGKPYGPEVDERLDGAMAVTFDQYLEALEWRALIRQGTATAFGRFDLIVTPTVGATVKRIGVDTIDTNQGEVFYRTALAWFSALVNVMGCPALAGPLPGSGTPPPSLQLIAPWWAEHRLLEVAMTLESAEVFSR
ncbi:MAG: amidase [Acidimicrobiia bacterium]|nr:amidase [Acidimicrobiia bacterium]